MDEREGETTEALDMEEWCNTVHAWVTNWLHTTTAEVSDNVALSEGLHEPDWRKCK
jgi:hypothetical protein